MFLAERRVVHLRADRLLLRAHACASYAHYAGAILRRNARRGPKRAWSVKGCRNPILAIGAIAIVASPFISLVPAMAIIALALGQDRHDLARHRPGRRSGGGRAGAAGRSPSAPHAFVVLRGSIDGTARALLLYALPRRWSCAIVAMVVLGGAYMGTLAGLNTSVQMHAPLAERSRILSLYTLSLSIFYPFGAFVQADLARVWACAT